MMRKLLPPLADYRRTLALCFHLGHAVACSSALLLGLLSYYNYIFFTCLVGGLLTASFWQGALRYEYWLIKAYEKKIVKALEAERAAGAPKKSGGEML